jgi:predicted PurR-regulated permease PerM
MNNRFATEFTTRLPDAIKSLFTADQLESLVRNPQALVSPESQAQLQALLNQAGPQGPTYFEQLLQTLRASLSSALSYIFFIGLFIVVIAWVVNLFLKEIPLRKHN